MAGRLRGKNEETPGQALGAVWWIKRDLRLYDNPALTEAAALATQSGLPLLPLFLFEPSVLTAPEASPFHVQAQCQALADLQRRLRERHAAETLVAVSEAIPALDALHSRYPFAHLVSHRETGTEITYKRDRAVAAWCRRRGVIWSEPPQAGVFRPLPDRDRREALWHEFMRQIPLPVPNLPPQPAWVRGLCDNTPLPHSALLPPLPHSALLPPLPHSALLPPLPHSALLPPLPHSALLPPLPHSALLPPLPHSALLPPLPHSALLPPLPHSALLTPDAGVEQRQAVTEPLAWATLRGFLDRRAARYAGGISSPVTAFKAGSRLSVHLAWGTLSARAVQWECRQRLAALTGDLSPEALALRRGLRGFSERLQWRDHFAQRLEDEPGLEFHSPHPLYEDLPCVEGAEAEDRLQALLMGRTGFPLVDACMRCAAETGFLNFRMRALVTSFACHGLRLDWRLLMAPLAALWTDYDPGIHVSQVQMQAGVVGTNTIRVYSPAKQLKDQDPALTFTRAWLPELLGAPDDLIRTLGVPAGPTWPGYMAALVDFGAESKLMKDVLYRRRTSPEGEAAAAMVQRRHGSRRTRPTRPAGRHG